MNENKKENLISEVYKELDIIRLLSKFSEIELLEKKNRIWFLIIAGWRLET